MPSKDYYCDCKRYCKGVRKKVSASSYYSHQQYRDPLSQYDQHLQDFLRNKPAVSVASSSNAWQRTRKRVVQDSSVSTDPTNARKKQRQQVEDDEVIIDTAFAAAPMDNDSTHAGPSTFAPQSSDDLSSNLPGNQLGDTGVHGSQSPGARGGVPDSTEGANDVYDTHTAPLDIPGPLDDPSPAAAVASDIPSGDVEDLWQQDSIRLTDLKTTVDFIKGLQNPTLDDPALGMSPEAVERLRNPTHEQPCPVLDDDTRFAIKLYLGNPSELTYQTNREIILDRYPDCQLPSYYKVKRLVSQMTGIESLVHDMCINSCVAYTGPFAELEACPVCSEARYDPFRLESSHGKEKVPRQEFHTIPIGPQLQALYRDPESAGQAHYLRSEISRVLSEVDRTGYMGEFSDVLHGTDLIDAFRDGRIGEDDLVLMFSIDGAQLYAMKQSACWIYIWVLFNLAPDRRYKKKHVFIGGFIPGPNNPKNTDSFLFPGLYHLAALQAEGLRLWDSALQREVRSKVFLALLTADGPGMMHVTGLVGYHGKHGCRLYCGLAGRREAHGKHYFPALLKPENYDVEGCMHDDIDVLNLPKPSRDHYNSNLRFLLASPNETQYRARRLATGISKPSIFSGLGNLYTLGLPHAAGSDIMHLGALNLSDLMIGLWRGTIDCTAPDDRSTWTWAVFQRREIWQDHGKAVAGALHYLPSSFDRPPRNIAEKLTSGYKAWEFLLYLYGLGPGLLYGVLPEAYYTNYCKLVSGMRFMNQHKITLSNLEDAYLVLCDFVMEFEALYCQRLPTRIHFVRPCLHSLVHLPREVVRLGPPICSSQWTLERTIGNLGEEIKQHSNPFANLSQRGIRRAQVNALKAMVPDLDLDRASTRVLPRGSKDLGDGYVLLRAREAEARPLRDCEADALREFLPSAPREGDMPVRRWAKLRLPTGQNCYSAWKEKERPLEKRRTARNVKVCLDNETRIAEVYFFIHLCYNEEERALALVSLFSRPDPTLLGLSVNTLWSCEYLGDSALMFIDVKCIQAVVAMVPHAPAIGEQPARERFFLVEKPGFDVAVISGIEEAASGEEGLQQG